MANGQLDSQTNGDPTTQSKGTPTHQQFADPDHQTLSSEQIPKPDNEVIDPKQSLEPFAWDDLETRFLQKMEECQRREEEIEKEFREWCHVFQAWASTTREHEEERLHKRLKTRIAWVQNSEQVLEEKRQH
ncbi:MAG: hypothetical protein Q9179_006937, partial [Wetmoreana sp. 5 TL-2023]